MNERSSSERQRGISSNPSTPVTTLQGPQTPYTSLLQLQKKLGNQSTLQLLQAQMQRAPTSRNTIQRVVDKNLKAATKVETPDHRPAMIIKETATGYTVVLLDTRKTQEFTYEELNMPEVIKQLPADYMTDLFKENSAKSPSERMKLATTTIDELFAKATKSAQAVAIPFVKSYSWLALGSYGRQEMCPFSDIELGIVYKVAPEYEVSPDHLTIKENLNKLGATVLAQLQKLAAFVTLDSEGNFPSGKGAGTLMGDANGLAKSIAVANAQEAMDARHTMLMDARYLPASGSTDEAFQEFLTAKVNTMSNKLPESDDVTQGDLNASHLAKLAINSLKMGVDDVKRQSRFLNIKKNFRQPLDWSLMALCVKHGLFKPVGYRDRLNALLEKQCISGGLYEKIVALYDQIFSTRIDLHLHHNEELDTVDSAPMNEEDNGGFNPKEIEQITSSNKGKEGLIIAEAYMGVADELLELMTSLS